MKATLTEQDALHLRRALELAEEGRGRVSPNPLVGAVLVRDGVVIGEGFHAELGGLHAERAALEDTRERGSDTAGAALYVTLEPCAHTGRQPPCAEAILEAGIARVVIGCDDPTAKASGRGPELLRDAGIDVDFATGAEAAAARLLTQPFRKRARTGRPLVTYKVAATIDGRVTRPESEERWISGPESRELVHRWRAEADAVAVGIGTVLADDPLLTARPDAPLPHPRTRSGGGADFSQPARIVFDREARLPLGSNLVATAGDAPLVVVAGPDAPEGSRRVLEGAGAELILASDLGGALDELGAREISNLLLEGGPRLAAAFLESGEIDELRLFIAPVLAASTDAPGLLAGTESLGAAVNPLAVSHETVGADLLIRARLREW